MKNLLTILFSIFLLQPLTSNAQKISFDLGIKVGANFSNINGKYWKDGYKANFLGGGYLAVNGGRIGVQLEGIFSQSTYVIGKDFATIYHTFYENVSDSLTKKDASFKVNYLSVPILLNIKLFSRATIQLGPQYSGVISVKDNDALLTDAKSLFKGSFDGVVGIWIKLPAHFNVGARYVIGLSDINRENSSTISTTKIDDAWKQRSLQLHLGYSLF